MSEWERCAFSTKLRIYRFLFLFNSTADMYIGERKLIKLWKRLHFIVLEFIPFYCFLKLLEYSLNALENEFTLWDCRSAFQQEKPTHSVKILIYCKINWKSLFCWKTSAFTSWLLCHKSSSFYDPLIPLQMNERQRGKRTIFMSVQIAIKW